jgi:hypothetical protein
MGRKYAIRDQKAIYFVMAQKESSLKSVAIIVIEQYSKAGLMRANSQ